MKSTLRDKSASSDQTSFSDRQPHSDDGEEDFAGVITDDEEDYPQSILPLEDHIISFGTLQSCPKRQLVRKDACPTGYDEVPKVSPHNQPNAHSATQLPDGRESLLLDIGSVGALTGEHTIRRLCKKGCDSGFAPLEAQVLL